MVLALLGLLALGLATMRLTSPALSLRLAPVLLSLTSGAAAALVARHALRLPERSARPWLALSLVAALLALGQAMATLRGAPDLGTGGWEDLPQLGAAPLGVAACLLLWPPRSGRWIGTRVLLDAAIVLVALTVLARVVLTDVLARTDGVAVGLIAVGYPAVGALMCGIGMLTVARVAHVRRRAATWLLAAIAAMTVVAIAGALGRVLGNAWFDVLTQVAWMGMLAAGIRAVDADRGQPAEAEGDRAAALPLLGIVLSHCAAYGVALLLVAGMLAGRPFTVAEGVGLAGLVLLTFLRSLLWAADTDGLARRLLRTEAYFRALVQSAEDVTVVLDAAGAVTWVSGAVRTQLGWNERELTGRVLVELVHVEDRSELARVAAGVHARMPVGERATCTVRLRARDGAEREVEVSGAARTGVPGTGVRDGLVLHLRDVTAHHSARRRLERMAYTDYLTGLPNRARFMEALADAGERASAGEPFCVLLVDLDGFKSVNDIAGHDAGDELLREIAAELRDAVREPDLVARLGGDEFAVLAPGGPAEVERLAARLVTALRRSSPVPGVPRDGGGWGLTVSGSIGVAELLPGDDASSAVRLADLALRAAKAAGKGCVRFSADALDDAAARRARLARDLPAALEQGQLHVVYQPIVSLPQRRVLGLEALVRWQHPVLGRVSPDEFIPLAEDDGLIVPLQRFVLETATADLAGHLAAGRDLKVGVNVSVRHLQAGCLAPDVARALATSALPPERLVIELTESMLLDAEDRLDGDLATLHEMGCTIALDDFGRGYSSLAYLARLPVAVLKMDREFVADIERDPRSAALVGSVIGLGRTLGMDVVAEGIETPGQVAALREMGCGLLQGFLLGRPVAAEEVAAVVEGFDPATLDSDLRPMVDAVLVH